MLHTPNPGDKIFVFSVYNKIVRALVKENESHGLIGDTWADEHRNTVNAQDEAEAMSIVSRRYPPEDGFVIQAVGQGSY